ncbi:hypothetical protein KFL_001690150 [Klebsormidium nitens]|uniref:F-box domain-containing protein n=1 Tax=Klebsormidium nitens TaxID=105231 RepID=A0A1Y1I5E1_KLENI|nr:hypothetical protein KFL_001690150 [Klebsormidium nitens]|eukprot:GAQ83937.1 hypothetical protein KFL_001690150 [Klebsormidium nitens]
MQAATIGAPSSAGEPAPHRPSSPSDVPHVLHFVFSLVSARDRCAAACVCKEWRSIVYHPSLWKSLDLQGKRNGGTVSNAVTSQRRFRDLEDLNLEFAQGVEDEHLLSLSGHSFRRLNLNACQKVTDQGISGLVSASPQLEALSVYWNLKVTDASMLEVARSCPDLTFLNISGCKKITDVGVKAVARACPRLQTFNLTRVVAMTDDGLLEVLRHSGQLQELYLYALSSLTDRSYLETHRLPHLRLLDLCGAANLSDEGAASVAQCHELTTLNLTWCVRLMDRGLSAIAHGCPKLESLSLYGILGITDKAVEELAHHCSGTLHTLDVNGCVNVKRRSKEDLLQLFPLLTCFLVHS